MREKRHFLFIQGPHGPFFHDLSRALVKAGHSVARIGHNQGDAHYWPDPETYVAFTGRAEEWPAFIDSYLGANAVTDIVVYGDTKPVHVAAKAAARTHGVRIHCFEEGYLRPYWITYERDGANGSSRLMDLDLPTMIAAIDNPDAAQPEAPAQWGAMWHHTLLGSLYHAHVLFRNAHYPHFRTHRTETVSREWALHFKRLLLYPWRMAQRRLATRGLIRTGLPYHVGLLQLGHDASVRDHSDIPSMAAFIEEVSVAFAAGAPRHHQLVFKAHPLEDGREDLARVIARVATQTGLGTRLRFIHGGKLGPLLDGARTAVTVNSTSAQQVLWRGLPLKAFGRSVYLQPEFVSDQTTEAFFRDPVKPDVAAYRIYRQFLLETSQVTGGYYTAEGRRSVTRRVVDLMLQDHDPYARLLDKKATSGPKLTMVSG